MYEADGFEVSGDDRPGGTYDVGDGVMSMQKLAGLAVEGMVDPKLNNSALSHGASGLDASPAPTLRAPPPFAAPPALSDFRLDGEVKEMNVAVEFTAKLQQKVQSQAGELAAMQHQLTQARSYSALCEQVKWMVASPLNLSFARRKRRSFNTSSPTTTRHDHDTALQRLRELSPGHPLPVTREHCGHFPPIEGDENMGDGVNNASALTKHLREGKGGQGKGPGKGLPHDARGVPAYVVSTGAANRRKERDLTSQIFKLQKMVESLQSRGDELQKQLKKVRKGLFAQTYRR